MAVVTYRCNVCNREKEFLQNKKGLEVINKCTITNNCRGTLYRVRGPVFRTRATSPRPADGLEDWIQRQLLYDHRQAIKNTEWTIEHNLGVFPQVTVMVDVPSSGDDNDRQQTTPTNIEVVDKNTVVLKFDRPESGIAQLVARETSQSVVDPIEADTEQDLSSDDIQITNEGVLTLATLTSAFGEDPELTFQIRYQTSDGENINVIHTAVTQPDLSSPWSDVSTVMIRGKIYTIRFVDVGADLVDQVPSGSTFRFYGIGSDEDPDSI